MAETIVIVERGTSWTAYFENAPHKKASDGQRARAIGNLIEDYGDHCAITIRVGTVEDNAVVTGTKTYVQLQDDLKSTTKEAKRLERDNEELRAIVDELQASVVCKYCGEQGCEAMHDVPEAEEAEA